MRRFKFTKFGIAEDPRGAQVTWTVGDRKFLADVVGVYRDEILGCTMLNVRAFCGEAFPPISASNVHIIGWSCGAHNVQ